MTRSGASAACASPPTRRSGRSSRAEYEALVGDGFAAEWRRRARRGRSRAASPRALVHPRDGALQPARWVRQAGGARGGGGRRRSRAHAASSSLDEPTRRRWSSCTDGYPSGLLGELEGLIVPTRGQVIATEPIAGAAVRGAALRAVTGSTTGSRPPTAGSSTAASATHRCESEFTDDEETTDAVQARARGDSSRAARRAAARSTTAGRGSSAMCSTSCPSSGGCPGRAGSGSRAATPGHGNVLGFACGELVARAIAGDRDPLARRCSSRRAPRLRNPRDSQRGQIELAGGIESSDRDGEVMDREPGRVEDRDLLAAVRPGGRSPARTAPSLRHLVRGRARPASTACARSPEWLACSQSSQKTRVRASSARRRSRTCRGRRHPGG